MLTPPTRPPSSPTRHQTPSPGSLSLAPSMPLVPRGTPPLDGMHAHACATWDTTFGRYACACMCHAGHHLWKVCMRMHVPRGTCRTLSPSPPVPILVHLPLPSAHVCTCTCTYTYTPVGWRVHMRSAERSAPASTSASSRPYFPYLGTRRRQLGTRRCMISSTSIGS